MKQHRKSPRGGVRMTCGINATSNKIDIKCKIKQERKRSTKATSKIWQKNEEDKPKRKSRRRIIDDSPSSLKEKTIYKDEKTVYDDDDEKTVYDDDDDEKTVYDDDEKTVYDDDDEVYVKKTEKEIFEEEDKKAEEYINLFLDEVDELPFITNDNDIKNGDEPYTGEMLMEDIINIIADIYKETNYKLVPDIDLMESVARVKFDNQTEKVNEFVFGTEKGRNGIYDKIREFTGKIEKERINSLETKYRR